MSAGSPSAETRERLLALLGPVVAATGYDLEDVSVTKAGRRSLVRISVDRDGGIDLDGVADVTRAVSDALDKQEPGGPDFAGPYVLEVSSPGVDRPLTEQRHWRRAAGRIDEDALTALLTHDYFGRLPPKSLDRNAFSPEAVAGLSLEDGAATLTAFTAASIARAREHFPEQPRLWVVSGGVPAPSASGLGGQLDGVTWW